MIGIFNSAAAAEQPANFLEIGVGKAKLSLLLQNWLIVDETNQQDKSNFRLRRAEIKLSGSVQEGSSWVVMIDPAKSLKVGGIVATNDNKILQDFILNYNLLDNLELSVGQFKIPTTAEGLVSSSNLILPERSLVGRTYGDKRDLGIRATWKKDKLKLALMASHGNKANTDDANSSKDLYLRGEYSPHGKLTLGSFFGVVDTHFNKKKWGVNLFWDNNPETFHFEYGNEESSQTTGVKKTNGYMFELGHFINPEYQAVLRYERLLFSRTTDIDSSATTIGLNYFLKDPNSKIQFATIFLNNMLAANGSYDVATKVISSSELYILSFQMGF